MSDSIRFDCVTTITDTSRSMLFTRQYALAADLDKFSKTWSVFDPHATLVISVSDLPTLLVEVGAPLGAANLNDAKLLAIHMGLQIMKGGHHFTEVFAACARTALGVESLDKEV